MKKLPERTRAIANGSYHKKMPALLWVSIGFDEETFAEIRKMAERRNCSFNAVTRELIEFGLETSKEAGEV